MLIRCRKSASKRRGAAAVEAALVLPVFFAVILGIVEFGQAFMMHNLITNAAREGARLAVLDGSTNADVKKAVLDFLTVASKLKSTDVTTTITITPAPGNTTTGNEIANADSRDLITIKVSVPFSKVSLIPGNYMKNKTMAAMSAMRHE